MGSEMCIRDRRITPEGLWITVDEQAQLLRVDTIVVCAGQDSVCDIMPPENLLTGARYHVIGGAKLAAELDAKRAIREGAELAARL